MGKQGVHHFFKEIIGDEDLLGELTHQDTAELYVEKVVELGRKLGYGFEPEDVRETIEEVQRNRGELSDEELEKAAGGAETPGDVDEFIGSSYPGSDYESPYNQEGEPGPDYP